MGTYSRGTYETLPTDDADLTTTMSAGEISDVATINNVFVGQNLSAQIAAMMFKNTCSASLANLIFVGQSDLAPSVSPIVLQAYNYSTAAWVGQATNAAAATNATCTLAASLGATQYLSPGGYTTGRVYQASQAWTSPNWTEVAGVWTPNPSYSSGQLFANPGFDTDTAWSKSDGSWTIPGGAGANCDGVAGNHYLTQTVGTAGIWSRIGAAVTAASAGLIQGFTGYDVATNLLDTTTGNLAGEMINRVTTDYGFNGTAFNGSIDNAYAYNLTTADLFMIQDFGSQKNIASNITVPTATLSVGGVVARMSDYNNFILGMIYYNGGEYVAVVYTVISGAYSRQSSTSITYGAGNTLEIRFPSADSAQLYYNNSTVASPVDVAAVPAGTKAGGFGTRSNVSITAPVAS